MDVNNLDCVCLGEETACTIQEEVEYCGDENNLTNTFGFRQVTHTHKHINQSPGPTCV